MYSSTLDFKAERSALELEPCAATHVCTVEVRNVYQLWCGIFPRDLCKKPLLISCTKVLSFWPSQCQGMTRPSIHSTGNFVYTHVDIYFLAGGQSKGSRVNGKRQLAGLVTPSINTRAGTISITKESGLWLLGHLRTFLTNRWLRQNVIYLVLMITWGKLISIKELIEDIQSIWPLIFLQSDANDHRWGLEILIVQIPR